MLTLKNTFQLSKIADKMNIELPNLKGKTTEEVGMEFINQAIKKAYKAEKEIIEFIATYKGISIEEAENIDILSFVEILKQEKGIISFFK